MRTLNLVTLGIFGVALAACAPSAHLGSPPASPSPRASVITGSDILATGGRSALDGIRLLRPAGTAGRAFLPSRNQRGEAPVVYLDGARLIDVASLTLVDPEQIESMRYLDASSATIRYGTGHTGGAVVVTTH